MGVEFPSDQNPIQSYPAKNDVHSHPLFKCKPISFAWRCKGSQYDNKCFSGMNKERVGNGKISYYCIECDIRYCEPCF